MPSFRKPNMSQINSAMNKVKSANSQFQREANRAIRDLKSLESKAKSDLRRFQSYSSPTVISTGSNVQNVTNIYEALHESPYTQKEITIEVRDVFISHASDDKAGFVQPLADEMTKRGISKWYDKEQAVNMWGHSLREELDNGIKLSRFSLVVFSKNYFKKYWTKRELDGILMKERIDNGQLLPIWYGINEKDMYEFSPMLSSMLAFSTEVYTINEICDAIESKIRNAAKLE